MDHFRYVTLLHLLANEPLALISVWSPTFLTTLLDQIPAWLERICADLHAGRIRLPGQAASVRAQQLSGIFAGSETSSDRLRQCWPGLSLISCWADGASAVYADQLEARFPSVPLQPKGLLATEGVVSIPFVGRPGSVLAIRSHFFEFREVADDPNCDLGASTPHLADELERNRRYRVLLTTGGGLYRYDLGDVVEVVDYHNQCPTIRFVGRGDAASDMVGEKLNEHHVRRVVQHVCRRRGIQLDFAMLVPVIAQRPHYRLYLEGIGIPGDLQEIDSIAAELDMGLSENPHYRLAVELNQLGPVDLGPLEIRQETAWQLYERHCRRRGQKTGDIKPTFLDPWLGWEDYFAAYRRA
jgi:hypothetical protein